MSNDFQHIDPDRIRRELEQKVRQKFNQFKIKGSWILLVIPLFWLLSGFVIVQPEEEAVMLRFGQFQRQVEPGFHWNWPSPVGRTIKGAVKKVQKLEVGFRTVSVNPVRYRHVRNESLMLTGDENIINLEFIVQYRISNLRDFLFNVGDPVGTLMDASESAMREVIGRTSIASAMTDGKAQIQLDTQDLIQKYADEYQAGIQIMTVKLQDVNPPDRVIAAFKDVISAQQDKERKINEAKGFENDIIPAARGEAAQQVNDAQGYKESRITEAQGEAARFLSLLREYRNGKTVTKARLYQEALEKVLPEMELVILDDQVSGNVLPHFSIAGTNVRKSVKGDK
ncbi:MAG: FtsH protease activity modulator HflK [Bdellovibrionales bacterium]|nr:FtsH protease activity modulator HflK [Bdellovibrionales bacterium]